MESKKFLSITVFWGALWGAAEATLGGLLHAADISIGWLVWFPIAFYFMNKVYMKTGKSESIILISVIAAVIKLMDLALPVRIDKVVNPAISILFEGLTVFAVYSLLEKNYRFRNKIYKFAAASFAWRILYCFYALFLPLWMREISPVSDIASFLKFLFLEGTGNVLLMIIAIKLAEVSDKLFKTGNIRQTLFLAKYRYSRWIKKAYYLPAALAFLIVALFIQWVL